MSRKINTSHRKTKTFRTNVYFIVQKLQPYIGFSYPGTSGILR